jgi:CBS domain-containing protein
MTAYLTTTVKYVVHNQEEIGMPLTIRQLLNRKTSGIYAVRPDASVLEALEMMAREDISSVLVMENDSLKGIFTERDYARKVILRGRNSRDTVVRELMTSDLFTMSPEQTIDDCMSIMTAKHIRHLPVLESGKVVGLVSIGDVVKTIIAGHEETIQQLAGYIAGDLKT